MHIYCVHDEQVRYVIGTKLRVEVAQRRFLNLKKREQEYALYDVALHQVRDELKKPCYLLCGRGLQGATIVGFSIRKWSRKEMDISVMVCVGNLCGFVVYEHDGNVSRNAQMKSLMVWVDAISTDLGVCRNGIVMYGISLCPYIPCPYPLYGSGYMMYHIYPICFVVSDCLI